MTDLKDMWWRAPKGTLHRATWSYVRLIEQENGDLFDRFVKLEVLYDPNTPDGDGDTGHVTENVIASGIDTVSAIVASTDIRARFMTDGASWEQRRRARQLEYYSEELAATCGILPKCRGAFKEGGKKGVGLTKSSIVFGKPRVERVAIENIVVDPAETRDGRAPRHFHQWDDVDVEELIARFPKHEEAILRVRGSRRNDWRSGSLIRPAWQIPVLFSWRLPVGVKGEPGYRPGREAVTVDGYDLFDAKYEDEDFPFAIFVWSERAKSFYGISGAERVMGIQRALNRRNWVIERTLDQNAVLTTYVRPADAAMTMKTTRIGGIVVVKGDYPQTPNPPVVSGETYQDRVRLKQSGIEELGVSQMAAHATKPVGIDSGVALREVKDTQTQRYASQEKGFEQLVLDTIWNTLACCKKLGKKAPTVYPKGRFRPRSIPWAKVDMREVRVQIAAASNLNRTPAGRVQAVIEYAQAGIVSQDEARALLQHPDLESALSLYTAALESVEWCLDRIGDGEVVMPEPYMNLGMCVWRGQQEYLNWESDGAPEEVLEALRQFVEQAIWFRDQAGKAVANQNAPAPDMSAAAPAPTGPAPTAALAPEAMQLRAG